MSDFRQIPIYRVILLFTFQISTQIYVAAQSTREISWSTETKQERKSGYRYFIGESDGYFKVLMKENRDFYKIQKYQVNDMSLVHSQEFELPDYHDEEMTLHHVFMVNGQTYFIAYQDLHKELRFDIYYGKFDLQDVPIDNYTKIGEISYERKREDPWFDFDISPDSSWLLLSTGVNFDRNDRELITFTVFDNSFELVWRKNLELPHKDDEIRLYRPKIANNRNIFIQAALQVQFKKGQRFQRYLPDEKHIIIMMYDEGAYIKEFGINLERDKHITNMSYGTDKNGNLLAAGFYHRLGSNHYADGAFFMAIDKDSKTVKSEQIMSFDPKYLIDMNDYRYSGPRGEMGTFITKDILIKDDGSATFISEFFNHYISTITDQYGNIIRTTDNRLYNDLFVMNITAEGKIDWLSRIHKLQHTINDDGAYSSYALHNSSDKLCFIFNEYQRNIEQYKASKQNVKPMFNIKKAIPILATLNDNHDVSFTPLLSSKDRDSKTSWRPEFYLSSIKNDNLILLTERKSTYKFSKIDFSSAAKSKN